MLAANIRASLRATASGSCSGSTTWASAPRSHTYLIVNRHPSRNATAATSMNEGRPTSTATAMLASNSALIASEEIIRRLRSNRSASMPAGNAVSASGSHLASPTTPALAGDPVNASTSKGNATVDACEPS
jgi:hypothetical protein